MQMRFKMAIYHECSYPPRCCYVIPLGVVKSLLDEASIQLYQKKEIEYQSTNRTYCHNLACQTFVPPEQISCGVSHCEDCNTYTCIVCKRRVHVGECFVGEEETQLWKTVEENGWTMQMRSYY